MIPKKINEKNEMKRRTLTFFLLLSLSLLIPYPVSAHPHVFIDYTIDFVFQQDQLIGIKTEWFFDEMYSSSLIQNYDMDGDGEFNDYEIATMEKDAFSNLENYNYFTYISIDQKCFEVESVKNFSSAISDDQVIYSFFIPFLVDITRTFREIEICMYDETYYVDLWLLEDKKVFLSNDKNLDYEIKIFEDVKESKDYGEIYPYSIRLTFRKKS